MTFLQTIRHVKMIAIPEMRGREAESASMFLAMPNSGLTKRDLEEGKDNGCNHGPRVLHLVEPELRFGVTKGCSRTIFRCMPMAEE